MWSVEEVKKKYQTFDDAKIKELARNPKGLRKEIIPLLLDEIKNRNLDSQLTAWVNYETHRFEGLEKKNLVDKIGRLKCSRCLVNRNLHAYRFNTLISALFVITDKTEDLVICAQCAKSKRLNTMLKTFFLGWWSKRGLIATPFTLISDAIRIFRKEAENKAILNELIENNTGKLRISLEENNLEQFIASFNNGTN